MCPNFPCVFTLYLNIFIHDIYLGYEKTCGEGCNFEIITFDYIYPKMSAKCAQQSMILTHQIFYVLNP